MYLKNQAIPYFPIGCFLDAATGLEVTTGTPSGAWSRDGISGVFTADITYANVPGEWSIAIPASVMVGDLIGLKFSLAGCAPIHFTIHTESPPAIFNANVTQWLGTNLPTPAVAGYPAVDVQQWAGQSTTITTKAQAGSSTTITLAASERDAADGYADWTIVITAGTGFGQIREITDYDNATKIATVSQPWTVVPDTTSYYDLFIPNTVPGLLTPDAGTVSASPSPTPTAFTATGASLNGPSGFYTSGAFTMALYFTAGANSGKSAKITAHTVAGSNHSFTVSALATSPAPGDKFVILGGLPV